MKNLTLIGNTCIAELNAIGIYPNKIDEFTVNTRAKSRWGQARIRNGHYTINISVDLLQDDCPNSAVRNTVFHELLHCVDGCMNHGKKWQSLADLVNDCYAMEIKRCSSTEEKVGVEYAKTLNEKRKKERMEKEKLFVVRCTKCGVECSTFGMRAPKWYVHTERYCCKHCKTYTITRV